MNYSNMKKLEETANELYAMRVKLEIEIPKLTEFIQQTLELIREILKQG